MRAESENSISPQLLTAITRAATKVSRNNPIIQPDHKKWT